MSAIVRASRGGGAAEISASVVYSAEASATLSEVNAGKEILAGVSGKQIIVVGILFVFTGSWGSTGEGVMRLTSGGTSIIGVIDSQFSAAVPVSETNSSGDVIVGAGFLAPLTAGVGVTVGKQGENLTGGTSVKIRLLYRLQ